MNRKRTVAFASNVTNIFFHILTKCNLACRHCYINPEQHGKNTLPLDTITEWLKLFLTRGRDANVIFLGGEPTLHPDLAVAAELAKSMGYGSVTVDTNGYLFNDVVDRSTPGVIDYFSFSLDGATREINDAIRGKGSYEACTAGIRKAVSRGFSTSLIYTVSRMNLHELELMPELIAEWGIDRFFIQVIGLRGKSAGSQSDTLQLTRSEWMDTIPETAFRASDLGITATYPKVYLEPGEPFECAALCAENYFIFPNRRVYRCPLCEDFPINGLRIENDKIVETSKINEADLYQLTIPEGCVMNRLVQPGNLSYHDDGTTEYRVGCCLLKEEIRGLFNRKE